MNRRSFTLTLLFLFAWGLLIHPTHAEPSPQVADELLGRINALRASVGVQPFTLNGALTAAAQNQASWMAQTGLISHTQSDGSTPRTRALAAGYDSQWVSENIYMGTSATAETAFVWWTNSPIHYRGMTASHYYEIGIASASANGQTAFVLVFGNPSTAVRVAPPITVPQSDPYNFAGNGSTDPQGESAAIAPPSFIIGQDDWGNYLHEVQPGHTLGDILFMYGYDWSDLAIFREINALTEQEGRNLAVGDVIKVPPYEGTWTPGPGTPTPTRFVTATASPEPGSPTAAPSATDSAPYQYPTLTPIVIGVGGTLEAPTEPPTATPAFTPTLIDPPTATLPPSATPSETQANAIAWTAATVTPIPGTLVAQLVDAPINPNTDGGLSGSPAETGDNSNNSTALLVMVIGVQLIVLGGAWFEFMRRGKKDRTA